MFKGSLVNLRAMEKEDIPILQKIKNEEEVLYNLCSGTPAPASLEAEYKHFEEYFKDRHPDNPQFVIEKKDGTIIGKCGAMDTDWKNSKTTVYIYLGGEENRSNGYGAEALKLLVSYIFNEMNLNRVQLFVFDFNQRAMKSYQKVGFKIEGVHRQDVFRGGKYNDGVQMSILKREYFGKGGEC